MRELYDLIEKKIKASGCPYKIDGEEFYDDVYAEVEQRENGKYIFLIKKTDTLSYKGCMTVLDEAFDLHFVDIIDGENMYHVDFDAE